MKSRLWTIRMLLAVLLCAAMMAGISGAMADELNNQEQVPNIITEGNIQRFAQRMIEWETIGGANGYTLHWVMPGGEEKEFTSEADAWITLPVHATCDVGICTAWVAAHTGDGDVAGAEKEFSIVSGQTGNANVAIMVNGEEIPDGGTAYVESGKYAEFIFSFSDSAGGTVPPNYVYVYDEDSTSSWDFLRPFDGTYCWEKYYETPGERIVAVQATIGGGQLPSNATVVEAGIRLIVKPESIRIDSADSAILGQDVAVTVNGVPEGESVIVTITDENGRVVGAEQRTSEGSAIDLGIKGYQILEQYTGSEGGNWNIRAITKEETASRAIRMSGTALPAPVVTVESATESETERQAMIGIAAPEGADRIRVDHVFFGASGELLDLVSEEYPMSNGTATISTGNEFRGNVWGAIVSAKVNGVWTRPAPVQYIPGSAREGIPAVTVSTDEEDPGTITVSAPGWDGAGCLIMMTTEPQLMEAHWSLTFEDGIATARLREEYRYKGGNVLQAALFENGRAVAWSEAVQVNFPQGAEHEPDNCYVIEATAGGSRKAGAADAVSLAMSTADGRERFGVEVYNAREELIWQTVNDGNELTFPAYVFNEPGTYEIECFIGENYLTRTLRMSIEQNQQPAAPVISGEVVKQDDHSYVEIEAAESGAPDGWYYEIIRTGEEWGNASLSSETDNPVLIRADMHGPGNYRIRACQVRNGICGPWGYGEYSYAMDTEAIEVVVPESVSFGEDYTISTPTTIPGGLPVVLRITDKATGEGVYFEIDTLNTRIFEMDGSQLPAGTYTATITAGTTVSGHKDYTIAGSGPEKPTLSANNLLLTGPGSVTFTVTAPGAESVYLSEGGTATDSFPVTDGTAEITISFSMYKNGKYEFRARAQANGVNSLWSEPVTIEVRTNLPDDNEWTEPVYTWAEDRRSVTASRYSIQDPNIKETETVAAAKIVVTSPGKETAGRWQEISDWFTNKAFSVQYGEEGTIPALDEMEVLYLPENIRTVDQEALAGTSCEAIYIPDGCSDIAEKAFANNTGLIYLRLPASVNEIPESAIEGCPNVLIDWEK